MLHKWNKQFHQNPEYLFMQKDGLTLAKIKPLSITEPDISTHIIASKDKIKFYRVLNTTKQVGPNWLNKGIKHTRLHTNLLHIYEHD